MRTIVLTRHEDFTDASGQALHPEVSTTIGYFATWGLDNPRYKHVRINLLANGDIAAHYRENPEDQESNYCILAVLDPITGNYSHHS